MGEELVARETQMREVQLADLEARWRALLNEEKQQRVKDLDAFARQLQDEGRSRQSDVQVLGGRTDELRGVIGTEVRDRRDADEALVQRLTLLEQSLAAGTDRIGSLERELVAAKQTALDLRGFINSEVTAREEVASRLHSSIEHEIRAREQGVQSAIDRCDDAEARMEQLVRAVTGEERAMREDNVSQLRSRLVATAQDLDNERSRSIAKDKDQDQIFQNMAKDLDELRTSLSDLAVTRERVDAVLSGQITGIDAQLNEECSSREAAVRDLQAQFGEMQERMVWATQELDMLKTQTGQRFDDERQERAEADILLRSREDAMSNTVQQIQAMLRDESTSRDAADHALSQRIGSDESALGAERDERTERDRGFAGRIAELDADFADMRSRLNETTQRCNDALQLREAIMQEKSVRQTELAALDSACSDHTARLDQVSQRELALETRLHSQISDINMKLQSESRDRSNAIQECFRRISDSQKAEAIRADVALAAARRREAAEARQARMVEDSAATMLARGPVEYYPTHSHGGVDRARLATERAAEAERARTPSAERRLRESTGARPSACRRPLESLVRGEREDGDRRQLEPSARRPALVARDAEYHLRLRHMASPVEELEGARADLRSEHTPSLGCGSNDGERRRTS